MVSTVNATATSARTLHHEVDKKVGADGGYVGDEEGAVYLRGDLGRRVVFHHRVPVGPFAAMDAHLVVEDCPRDVGERKLEIFISQQNAMPPCIVPYIYLQGDTAPQFLYSVDIKTKVPPAVGPLL